MRIRVFCEYMPDPVGIDTERPRFSWVVREGKNGGKQKSYRILVAKNKACLKDRTSLAWDSGIVISEESLNIPYGGERLETGEVYYFQVLLEDLDGTVTASEIRTFTTGIMGKDPWKADWLGGPWIEEWAFWFRSVIRIEKKLKNAFVYVVSPNYYVLTVNGKRCTDAVLQNANTDGKGSSASGRKRDWCRAGKWLVGSSDEQRRGGTWRTFVFPSDASEIRGRNFRVDL